MLSVRRFACAAALSFATLNTSAAPPVTGFYIGAGAGQSRYNIDFGNQVHAAYDGTVFSVTSASMDRRHDTAWRLIGGYQFSPYTAVEGGWQDLGSAKGEYALLNSRNGETFARRAEWDLLGFNATLVGIYPFAERFAVTGKVGAFFSKLEFSETTTQSNGTRSTFHGPDDDQVRLTWGIGGSYRITDNLSARLDWDRIEKIGQQFALNEAGNGRFRHVDLWSLNLIWKF